MAKGKKKGLGWAVVVIPVVLVVALVGAMYAFYASMQSAVTTAAKSVAPTLLNTVSDAGASLALSAYESGTAAAAGVWTQLADTWSAWTSDDEDEHDYGESDNS